MRINELLVESEQQDEGLGSLVGKGIGAVGKGIGAVASVPQGLARAIKKGYQAGVDTIGGTADTPNTSPGTTPTAGSTSNTVSAPSGGNGFAAGFKKGFGGNQSTTTQAGDQSAGTSTSAPSSSTGAATNNTPKVPPAQDEKFISTLQHLSADEAVKIKQMLSAKAGVAEAINFGKVKKFAGNVANGARNLMARGAAATTSAVKRGANAAVDVAKATPGALATAGGGIAGGLVGMKNAARKGYSASKDAVGGGAMTFNELQRAIATMSSQDAKELLGAMQTFHPDAAAPSTTAPSNAVDTNHPSDDNPNIGLGTNESKVVGFRSKFLGMDI